MSPVENSPQLSTPELHRLNFFLGSALCLVSIVTIVYLEADIFSHFLFTIGIISLFFFWPKLRLAIPAFVWKGFPAVILLMFLHDAVFRGDLLESLVRLNLLLMAFRCISFRNRREDLQLILLCLFVIIIGGVLTVSFVYVIQMLLYTALGMCFLFNINLLEGRRGTLSPSEIWGDFRWGVLFSRLWGTADFRFVGFSSFLFVSIVSLSSMIFLVLPRIDFDSRLSFMGLGQSVGVTGFSDNISLNDITQIQEDHRTALRIKPPLPEKEAIPADPYWRMLVLDEYNQGRFKVSAAAYSFHRDFSGSSLSPADLSWPGARNRGARGDWTFYMEGGVAQYLPLGGPFREFRSGERGITFRNFPLMQVLGIDSVKSSMFSYQVSGMEFSDKIEDSIFGRAPLGYGEVERESLSQRDRRLGLEDVVQRMNEVAIELPLNLNDQAYLRQEVEVIRQGEDLTPREFAARARDYLQGRHAYSLSSTVQGSSGDVVVRWMRQRSEGHCEYFAASMILLTRTAGYPARAVTGFYGGTWNPFENYLMVRFSDAHAWVEIYDEDDAEWFRMDATPAANGLLPSLGVAANSGWGLSIDSSLGAYLDSIRVLWYQQVVSFDEEGQEHFFAAVKDRFGGGKDRFTNGIVFLWTSFIDGWKEGRGIWQVFYITVTAAMLVVLFYGFRRLEAQVPPFLFFGREKGTMDPVRRRAARWLRRIAKKQTLATSGSVPQEEFFVVRRQLQSLRYGPRSKGAETGPVFRAARYLVRRLR